MNDIQNGLWKDKYKDAIQTFEKKSHLHSETISQLRSAIGRLSVTAYGIDTRLDKALSSLRDDLRDDADNQRVFKHIERICKIIKALDIQMPSEVGVNKDVIDILYYLLENVEVPDEFNERVDIIRQKIKVCSSKDVLVSIVDEVSQLLTEIANRKQYQLEDFVLKLQSKLQNFQSYMQDSSADDQNLLDNSQLLENSVSREVENIHAEIKSEAGLEKVADMIGNRFEKITTQINDFRVKEEMRIHSTQDKVKILEAQLQETQDHALQLEENLSEQRHLARHDTLTGLANRQTYNEHVDDVLKRYKRSKEEGCIVLGDIDCFKKINDNYGHIAGDKVLKKIANILRGSLREVDFIARYGGEEFVIVLEKTPIQNTEEVINRTRQMIEDTQFHFRSKRVPITMSFGVSRFIENDSPPDVFERADKALYQAKESGRNCVILAKEHWQKIYK